MNSEPPPVPESAPGPGPDAGTGTGTGTGTPPPNPEPGVETAAPLSGSGSGSGSESESDAESSSGPSRRDFLKGAGVGIAAAAGFGGVLAYSRRPHAPGELRPVFLARVPDYDVDLIPVLADGWRALDLPDELVRGKTILLKPNLVEPSLTAPHINTHPRFVRGAIEFFRALGAGEVLVAEGQGHCRDTDYVLEQSGLGAALDEAGVPFVDLNHDDLYEVENVFRATSLPTLTLPRTLKRADLIVSLPKMKTHHWAGITASMKNFFGVMPGIRYGWPKNVLHFQGIPAAILDINAAVRPHLAIVDGVVAMEGDGPIMGTPKAAGLVAMGANLPAVDATLARLMDLDPRRIAYLARANNRLGPIDEARIPQRGETVAALRRRFELVDHPITREFRDPGS